MKIHRCPHCRSTKINLHAGAITGAYHCHACGLITSIVIEEDIDTDKQT